MTVVLIGASPPGTKALGKLNMPFILIAEKTEDINRIKKEPINIIHFSYTKYPDKIIELIPLIKEIDSKISCCISFTEEGVYPASLLSRALGLKSNLPSAINLVNNKYKMRNQLNRSIKQPRFGVSKDLTYTEFDIIVKPISGSGSENISLITKGNKVGFLGNSYFWEEFIEGEEYSVETVSYGKTHQLIGITRKFTTGPPNFVETMHITPGTTEKELIVEVKEFVFNVLNNLNIEYGAAHTEIIITKDRQIYLVETHGRPGGDNIPFLTELTTGIDQYALSIMSLSNNYQIINTKRAKHKYAAILYPTWEPIINLKKLKTYDWVIQSNLNKDITKIPNIQSSSDRPGFIIISANSYKESLSRINQLKIDLNSKSY